MGMWGLKLRVLRVYMVGLVKGGMISEFAYALNFAVANTWFRRMEEG